MFYFEPVNIIKVSHKVDNVLINTEKNLGKIVIPTATDYDISDFNYAPKKFESLNKNFWPGYILTGYKVYGGSEEEANIIAKQTYDVNTTTKMNSEDDAKRYTEILTAITSVDDINGAEIVKKESLGYGKDKIIVFEYLYPEVEINNVKYGNNTTLMDINNQLLLYKIKLMGDNMIVRSLDTTTVEDNEYKELNITLSNGLKKSFKYDLSNYSLVQAWIYTKDLNKNTKTLYKVIAGNESFVPNGVPNEKIQIANDFSSFANYYILSTEELLTVMNKVWSDLYIEFRYYEGANIVNVSYVDDEGNTLMPPEVYKMLEKIDGRNGAIVPITKIDGYKLIKYVLDGSENNLVTGLENVKVIDNGLDRKLIFVYTKGDSGNNEDEPPENFENPFAIIRSNERGDEEYNVDVAIPTDEDLYANVVTDSYKIEEVLSILDEVQRVNITLKKKYYTTNNDNDSEITSDIAIATATIPIEYDLDYVYYGGGNSRLFILDTAIIENEAVMDTKHYDKNGKVLMEANYASKEPTLTYIQGGKLFINNSEECTLLKDENGIYYLEIMLGGIDYEEPNMNELAESYQNDHKVIDQIIRKNAVVNGDYLCVYSENEEVVYLDGLDIYMSAERLANVTELIDAGYYYSDSKAPLTNNNILFNNKQAFSFSKSKNEIYPSTKLTLNYVLYQYVEERQVKNISLEKILESELKSLAIKNVDNKISMYKDIREDCKRIQNFTSADITMNDINIHTPIVNYTKLIPLNNSGDNDNQLIDSLKENVLTLDSVFTIEIPHSGMHIYAVNDDGTVYDGYGDKEYNYDGVKAEDELGFTSKGLKRQRFAKNKLVKFSFDTYVIKYDNDGEIKDKKLILANTWFDLGELDKKTGLNIEKYNFIIPVWVKDNESGEISVRIVASNIPEEYDVYEDASYVSKDVANSRDKYILQEDINVFISGVLYDLQIRDSDDIGWIGNLKSALKIKNSSEVKNMMLPIGQVNQNKYTGYKYALKVGYRFYFDLKTKGIANDAVIIIPEYYYVSADGGEATKDISLFYDTVEKQYVKLNESNNVLIRMQMANTHGEVNNTGFLLELIKGKFINPDKDYTQATVIGNIFSGLELIAKDNKLPRNNLLESANLYGYKGNTNKFVEEAMLSASVESEDSIRNANGHWYGEFYLPSSTKVALGATLESDEIVNEQSKILKDGYILVVFKTIETKEQNESYLSYSKPDEDSRWKKEGATYLPYEVKLPNGNIAKLSDVEEGVGMAIYEIGISANDDFESEGTH